MGAGGSIRRLALAGFEGDVMENLRELLPAWTDIDLAAHELAKVLGLVPADSSMANHKWLYWSNNPLGNELYYFLDKLVDLGVLEKRDEPGLQCRANCDWKLS